MQAVLNSTYVVLKIGITNVGKSGQQSIALTTIKKASSPELFPAAAFKNMKFSNEKNVKMEIVAYALAPMLFLGILYFPGPIYAGENDPQIEHVLHRGRRSVEMQIEDDRFQNDKVRIKVEVFNVATGVLVKTKNFTDKLDESGQTKVRIGRLQPGTEYKFKVRVREHGKSKDYKNSDSKTIKTKSE